MLVFDNELRGSDRNAPQTLEITYENVLNICTGNEGGLDIVQLLDIIRLAAVGCSHEKRTVTSSCILHFTAAKAWKN